jgi:hypothetical protein
MVSILAIYGHDLGMVNMARRVYHIDYWLVVQPLCLDIWRKQHIDDTFSLHIDGIPSGNSTVCY